MRPVAPQPFTIGFLGFHKHANPHTNFNLYAQEIMKRFSVIVSQPGVDGHLSPIPDILFTSVFDGSGYKLQPRFWDGSDSSEVVALSLDPRYDRCVKIHASDENIRLPWDECDYAITGDYTDNPSHLRLPVYVNLSILLVPKQESVKKGIVKCSNEGLVKDFTRCESDFRRKTKFCCFLYSNPRPQERILFFEELSKYKHVDSGGLVRNNMGKSVPKPPMELTSEKLIFIRDYKFVVAFENTSYPGYVTEKLTDPMFVNSMPIYWGCPRVGEEFNTRSFVNATGRSFKDVIEEIVELDSDDDKYLAKLSEPWFEGNVQNQYCELNRLGDFLAMIVKKEELTT
jgi:hypothetical protein